MPQPLRRRLRRIAFWPLDTLELLTGRRDALTPPRGVAPPYVRAGGFREHGQRFAQILIQQGSLQPGEALLDVGCGIGRIAVPLTGYLEPDGRYEGIDVEADAIAWCRRAITPRFPNFHFQVVDVRNARYRPDGSTLATAYQFPFADASFDMVLLKSVFTHMLVDSLRNYVDEIARVLRPGAVV